jgi:hypothetical protein
MATRREVVDRIFRRRPEAELLEAHLPDEVVLSGATFRAGRVQLRDRVQPRRLLPLVDDQPALRPAEKRLSAEDALSAEASTSTALVHRSP